MDEEEEAEQFNDFDQDKEKDLAKKLKNANQQLKKNHILLKRKDNMISKIQSDYKDKLKQKT